MSALTLVLFLVLSFSAAFFGSQFMPGEWYAALTKPSWNPPSWLFGPVWSVLYTLIGIAGWMVWRAKQPDRRLAMTAFSVQLILNALWSWFFFGLKEPGWALAEILLLLAAIVWTSVLFHRTRPLAGRLLFPYLAWVSFATFLNFTLWRLNT